MTRKIILFIATSLDGFIADTQGNIDWLHENTIDSEKDTAYDDFYTSVDTVIMGRTTYDQVTTSLSPDYYPYADSQSYIMTTQGNKTIENITFTNENLVELVTTLKEQDGKNVFIVGGASIVKPLMESNLIDEYQLAIIPTVLGSGIPLFTTKRQLKLNATSAKVVNNIVYHTYEKIDN